MAEFWSSYGLPIALIVGQSLLLLVVLLILLDLVLERVLVGGVLFERVRSVGVLVVSVVLARVLVVGTETSRAHTGPFRCDSSVSWRRSEWAASFVQIFSLRGPSKSRVRVPSRVPPLFRADPLIVLVLVEPI